MYYTSRRANNTDNDQTVRMFTYGLNGFDMAQLIYVLIFLIQLISKDLDAVPSVFTFKWSSLAFRTLSLAWLSKLEF